MRYRNKATVRVCSIFLAIMFMFTALPSSAFAAIDEPLSGVTGNGWDNINGMSEDEESDIPPAATEQPAPDDLGDGYVDSGGPGAGDDGENSGVSPAENKVGTATDGTLGISGPVLDLPPEVEADFLAFLAAVGDKIESQPIFTPFALPGDTGKVSWTWGDPVGYTTTAGHYIGNIPRLTLNTSNPSQGCISFFADSDDRRVISILHPERYADISYYKTCYRHFPLPRLVFRFSLHQGLRVNGVSVGIVEEKGRLGPDTKMFRWPFSNVNGFRMCIGNNVMPKCESLHTLSSLPYLILEIPNNNDHFHSTDNQMGMGYRELLEHLRDKDPSYYYDKVLIPDTNTLTNFIRVTC